MSNKGLLKSHIVWGWFYLIVGFFGFFFWAASYPLEQGVSGYGFVISKAEKISVTSPANGLVRNLYKKLGDKVIKGDVLIDFDVSVAEHSLRSTQQSLVGVKNANTTLHRAYLSKMDQVNAIEKQFQSNKKLMEAGFLSKTALLQFQNQLSLAESEALEIKAEIEKNASKELELKEQILGINQQMSLQKVLSPVDGSIMNLGVKSAGVSVSQGQALMDIVPNDGSLVIDARLPVEYVDRIQVTSEVDVLFPTLSGSKTIHFKGILDYISADKIIDPRTNQAYVEARILIVDKNNPEITSLKIGLPATIIIKTGKRTLLSYLVRPFVDRLSMGLK